MNKKDVNDTSNEDFVKLWLAAYKDEIGLKGLVLAQNWDYGQASSRASGLRRAGVKLPTMKSPQTKNNYLTVNSKALNAIIVEQLGKEALSWRTR